MSQKQTKGLHMQLRAKLILFVGVLLLCTIIAVTVVGYFNLSTTYNSLFEAEKEAFDANIHVAVENMISTLEVNHQRYLDGDISEREAYDQAVKYLSDVRFNSGEGYFWAYTSDGTSVLQESDATSAPTLSNPSDTSSGATAEGDATSGASINLTDQDGSFYVQEIIASGAQEGGGYTEYFTEKPDHSGTFLKRSFTMKFEPYGWYINTGNFMDQIQEQIDLHQKAKLTSLLMLVLVSIGIAIAGGFILYMILNRLTGPLKNITKRMQLLAEGDVQTPPVPIVNTGDEIGTLTRTTESLINHMNEMVLDISNHLAKMSRGDLTDIDTLDYIGDFIPIQNAIHGIHMSLNNTLREISISAEEVNSGAQQVANAAHNLAMGATEQAATIDELTASVTHIAHQAEDNVSNVKLAAQYVTETSTSVEDGNSHMKQLTTAMNDIRSSSDQITSITKVMEDIAFQTNILALNASIEASTAGQYGKGFAVVAEEVRSLAAKSAEAAQKTGELIQYSATTVSQGTKIAAQTAQILRDIADKSSQANTFINKIEGASIEQSKAIDEITEGLSRVSDVVQANAATAEQSSAASEELSAQAYRMNNEVSNFKLLQEK